MRTLKYIAVQLCVLLLLTSCDTKQDWVDTGVSSPYHDCSMMEYLRGDKYNWELTVQMIERGGLTDMFEGKEAEYEKITFFAIPSYSILRYLWDNDLETVNDLTSEFCRTTILNHVVKGKYLKADIAYRNMDYLITDEKQDGGTSLTTEGGRKLKAYVDKTSYGGVPDVGAEIMYLHSFSAQTQVPLATPDIQPLNGVVHALNYNFVLGKI